MSSGKKYKFLFILFLVALSAAGYYVYEHYYSSTKSKVEDKENVLDKFYSVKKGDLTIGIIQSGNINSKEKHKLKLEAAFRTKLVWVIDESSDVKKGETLAKFETEDLLIKIDDLKLKKENIEKEITMALEEKKILKSTNQAEIKNATDKLINAEDAYRKYHKFEKHKKKDEINLKIQETKTAMAEAVQEHKEYSEKLSNESFIDEEEKEKATEKLQKLADIVHKTKINFNNAVLDRKVFKRYSLPSKITSLSNDVEQAKLDLNKTKIKTESSMVQKNKSISNLETQLKKVTRELKKHEGFVPLMEMKSPSDGIVIYGDPDRRWGKIDIKVGMDVNRGRVLLTIPDMSDMIANFDLPEKYRSKVKIGDKVVVAPDSVVDLKLEGKIDTIAPLPINQIRWDPTSPKIYKSTVKLSKQDPRLVSGMSVQIEIITNTLKDVMYIPVEAVFETEGNYFVYEKDKFNKPEKVNIEIGLSNDRFVQIKSGLNPGDTIYLYKPYSN